MSNDKKDIDNLNLNNRNESEQEPEPLTLLWTRLLGTSGYDEASGIATANDGSIYITGVTDGPLDGQTNSGDYDAFLTKYSENLQPEPVPELNVTNELLPNDINHLNYVLGNWGNSGLTYLHLYENANK